jgi:hypothetical protein
MDRLTVGMKVKMKDDDCRGWIPGYKRGELFIVVYDAGRNPDRSPGDDQLVRLKRVGGGGIIPFPSPKEEVWAGYLVVVGTSENYIGEWE